ncbi:hypothetical protein BN182_1550011 [Clostridioides difficile E9]|nr:hypothetical protein BN182_1550011 [Clostridioides difficile E9]
MFLVKKMLLELKLLVTLKFNLINYERQFKYVDIICINILFYKFKFFIILF